MLFRPAISTVSMFVLITIVTFVIGKAKIYTGFDDLDDEGYMLIALKSFLDGATLYDSLFGQYGPFYYESWGAIFAVLRLPISHDNGRMITLLVWVSSGLGIGLSVGWIMRDVKLGLIAQIVSFAALTSLTNEPMHPGGLITGILVLIVLLATSVTKRSSRTIFCLLGVLTAALSLVKINVGIFALASIGFVVSTSYGGIRERQWFKILIYIAFIGLPIAVMAQKIDNSWVQQYAVHVSVAAFALVLVSGSTKKLRNCMLSELVFFAMGLIAAFVLINFYVILLGTPPRAVIEGIIFQPLRQAGAFSIPLNTGRKVLILDLIALFTAIAYVKVLDSHLQQELTRRVTFPLGIFCVGVGVLICIVALDPWLHVPGVNQLSFLAFSWVALIEAPGEEKGYDTRFARQFLPALAVMQALHAYPVAGSQISFAGFLLVPIGTICFGNGLRFLSHQFVSGAKMIQAVTLTYFIVIIFLAAHKYNQINKDTKEWVPLALKGANELRLPQSQAYHFREITHALDKNCRAFFMMPGMNSFYLWSAQEPPTYLNSTTWMTLFPENLQRRVVDDLRDIEDLCLLRNQGIVSRWLAFAATEVVSAVPKGPLVRFLENRFQPVATFGSFELLKRRPGSDNFN